ncbi:TPA: accessory Sec-dependent serine-rich glycoprotein adhesin, partial [Streptococcus suis]
MNSKRFNKNFDEIDRKSKVRMHKSGKNWVTTVVSQLSLLRVARGQGQGRVALPVLENRERLDSQRLDYLRAVLASGAAVTGAAVTTPVFAEEQVVAVEQEAEGNADTVANQDYVVIETVSTEVVSEMSGSGSVPHSSSLSASELASQSTSISSSESASFSASESASYSASESSSISASESHSLSLSSSESYSFSSSQSDSDIASSESSSIIQKVDSIRSRTESVFSDSSASETSVSQSADTSTNLIATSSHSLSPLNTFGIGQGLTLLNSAAVRTANASSELVAAYLAASLNSDSSSQSEVAQLVTSLDYSNLDNAVASLHQALSLPVIDETTTTATRYQRYKTALQIAEKALTEALDLRNSTSASQEELEVMAKRAAQAAISLDGRIKQIQAAGGKFAGAEGTGTRAITWGGAGGDANTAGVLRFEGVQQTSYFYDFVTIVNHVYNAETDTMHFRITFNPHTSGKIGVGLALDSTSDIIGVTIDQDASSSTSRATLGSRESTSFDGTTSNKGEYIIINNVTQNQAVTVDIQARTNGYGITNARLKAANITNFYNGRVNGVNQQIPGDFHIRTNGQITNYNGLIDPDIANINKYNNPAAWAIMSTSASQVVDSRVPDAPRINDDVTDAVKVNYEGLKMTSTQITGTGTPGAKVVVTLTDGYTKKEAIVGNDGRWSVDVLPGQLAATELNSADPLRLIKAVQHSHYKAVNANAEMVSKVSTATVLDNIPPAVEITLPSVYVFEGQSFNGPRTIANIADQTQGTGLRSVEIIAQTSDTDNSNGMSVNTDGYLVGTPTAGSIGQHINRLKVTDNEGNVTRSSEFDIYVLRANDFTLTRDYTGNNKFTREEIIAEVKRRIATDSGLPTSVIDEIQILPEDHIYRVGTQVERVLVRTPNDYTNKYVNVTINYRDVTPPAVNLSTSKIYVFHNESIKLLDPSTETSVKRQNPVSTNLQLATLTDDTGIANTAAIHNRNNDSENSKGLTVSLVEDDYADDPSKSKIVNISGQTSGNLGAGYYYNYIKVSDTASPTANTTVSGTRNAQFDMVLLKTNVTAIADRDLTSSSFRRVTEQEILDAVTVDFGTASAENTASGANIRKVLLSNTDNETNPTFGEKTAVVRVYTSSNTYKDVPVNFTYRDMTAPTATLTATSLYAFEGQALQAPIKIANLADNANGSGLTGGQATTQIVMESSTTENGKGLTINTNGQVSGTPTAGSQGVYTNRVLVRDNAGNTGYSNNFNMYILRVNPVTATREYTGNNKFTTAEITDLIKNQIAADSGISVTDLSALTYTIPDHTYAVGSQTIQATVRTPAGDTKTVPVTLTYTDTTNPTITNRKDVTVFIGKPIEMVGSNTLIPVTATDVSGVRYSLNNAGFGVTVDSTTGQLQGTATGSPGYNTRTVTVTDGQGRTTTSENFKIYLIQATPTTVTREYGQTISADEIKNAITLNRGTNGSSVAVNMELLDPIP